MSFEKSDPVKKGPDPVKGSTLCVHEFFYPFSSEPEPRFTASRVTHRQSRHRSRPEQQLNLSELTRLGIALEEEKQEVLEVVVVWEVEVVVV